MPCREERKTFQTKEYHMKRHGKYTTENEDKSIVAKLGGTGLGGSDEANRICC